MTQTLIEQLEALHSEYEDADCNAYYMANDLRAIIEQHMRESGEAVSVEKVEAMLDKHGAYLFYSEDVVVPVTHGDVLITQDQLLNLLAEFTSPQPSHTKLIGELVQALDDVGAWINNLPAGTKSATAKGLMIDALLAKAKEHLK